MPEPQSHKYFEPPPGMLSTWIGVVLLFVLFGAIVLAVVGPSPRHDTFEQARAKKREDNLKAAREADTKALSSYGWVDKNKGVAHLPIDRAMQLTLAELSNKKPAPANPIATPEAQASAAPAGAAATSPAPSVSPQPSGTPKPTSVAGPSSESRGQPAAAINPPPAPPGTQPGASLSPAASPVAPATKAPVSASPIRSPSPPGSPLPVPGKTP